MVDFDLTKELLPGLPAYDGGRMSDGIYNAGDGLYDTRVIEGDPNEIPFLCDGAEMTDAEFNAALTSLDRAGINYHYQYAKGGIGLRIRHQRRMINVQYCGGIVHTQIVDDYVPSVRTPVYVRAVTETDEAAFLAYLAAVRTVGYQTVFEHEIEGNLIAELTGNGHLLHAVYTPGDSTARFCCDAVSEGIDTFGYQTEPKPGKTEIYQFGLYYTVMRVGFTCDCGMCYLIKLSDNALFFVDGGHYSQATEEATEALWTLMHEITGTPMGGVIRIAGFFCTHAHSDHMDMFSRLLRLHHEEIKLERVMFNFVADEVSPICTESFLLIHRIRKYYPEVRFRKLHMGDMFTLADARFEVLQTHEDSIGAAGNEIIGAFNDTSTVLKVTFDGRSFLILGDIDNGAEDVLLRHYTAATLHTDIVQCAHHVFNKLERLYDVIDADWALVPQGERVRTNHDAPKYEVIARTVPYDNFLFSNQFTDGLRVNAETGEVEHHYHVPQIGGVYDGAAL